MVLIGVLGAVGASRFFDRSGFDAAAFAEQTRSMMRFAQKLAVAQNRQVYVLLDGDSVALCFDVPGPGCAPGSQVLAPSGANSGSAATNTYCGSATWFCEGRPDGIHYRTTPALTHFAFDALGRPGAGASQGLSMTITGDGETRTVSVVHETGYVQ
jgi:MSHA pilin protein MshC